MSKVIILNNNYAKLDEPDDKVFRDINNLLSYRLTGIEYSPAYKNSGWDGTTYVMNKKREFPLGLLDTVKNYYAENNLNFEVEDIRKPFQLNTPLNISEKLKQIDKVPRSYQQKVADLVLKERRGIVRVCTGGGKTLISALITANLNKPTNIYVIGLDLMSQFKTFLEQVFDEPIGVIGGGICKIERINVVSMWTAGRALDLSDKDMFILDDSVEKEDFDISNKYKIVKALEKAKVHIFDECHICGANTAKIICNSIDAESIYGMSATPIREDGADILLTGLLGEIIVDISASSLIEAGVLVPPIIKFINVPSIYTQATNYQQMYKEYIVENSIRNSLIIENTKKLVEKGYPTLVLFKTIRHGEILFELMQEAGIKCALLNGKNSIKYRNQVKEQLENKDIDVIVASTILDIGFDLPAISGLVLAGSGKSSVRARQRIGRVIRSFPGKKRAIVIDFYDQARYVKHHSRARYNIYKSEKGFNVLPLKTNN
jgi:superfamily II DNA or RNA helicase